MESLQDSHANASWSNGSYWTMESSQHSHVNCSWLNGSCWTIESSQHSLVNSNWIHIVVQWNHHSILTWTRPEWMDHFWTMKSSLHYHINPSLIAHVELWIHCSILTWTRPERLMLEYEIIKYSRELLPNSRCCTLESSQHYHENAPWMVPVGLQTHHGILT